MYIKSSIFFNAPKTLKTRHEPNGSPVNGGSLHLCDIANFNSLLRDEIAAGPGPERHCRTVSRPLMTRLYFAVSAPSRSGGTVELE